MALKYNETRNLCSSALIEFNSYKDLNLAFLIIQLRYIAERTMNNLLTASALNTVAILFKTYFFV